MCRAVPPHQNHKRISVCRIKKVTRLSEKINFKFIIIIIVMSLNSISTTNAVIGDLNSIVIIKDQLSVVNNIICRGRAVPQDENHNYIRMSIAYV